MKLINILLLTIFVSLILYGCNITYRKENVYERNKTQSSECRENVPDDLDEAFEFLESILSDECIDIFKETDPVIYHRTLGLWIRNNWELQSNKHIAKYLIDSGKNEFRGWEQSFMIPDNSSGLILELFNIHLNNPELSQEELLEMKKERWRKIRQRHKKEIENIINRAKLWQADGTDTQSPAPEETSRGGPGNGLPGCEAQEEF